MSHAEIKAKSHGSQDLGKKEDDDNTDVFFLMMIIDNGNRPGFHGSSPTHLESTRPPGWGSNLHLR